MSKTFKTHPIYESPKKDQNEEKYGILSGNQCICCMRPMKAGETKAIHAVTSWEAVNVDESELPEGYTSQGLFPVGNSCAKKFPKEFIF